MARAQVKIGEPTLTVTISPAWLTADGAAAYTSLTADYVKAAFRHGDLPGYRHGRRTLRFKITDLDAWMSAAEVKASNVVVSGSVAGITSGFRTNPSRRGRSS
ncbi:MAG: excisionase family DNA-binding protein [Actinomycetota bacterium]|nr:excisionase family DNA-binding protein [Actinomycetota bacterium]